MSWHDGDELGWLLGDFPAGRFFDEHWERRALVLPGPVGRFAPLYDAERFRTHKHLREIDAATVDADGVQTQTEITASQIDARYEEGSTICADVSTDPAVRPFLLGLKSSLALIGAGAFAKIYASPDGGGFAVHADPYHVFVMQLEGKKRWKYSAQPATVAPIAGLKVRPSGQVVFVTPLDGQPALSSDGSPLAPPDLDKLDEVTLTEGDCLYLPPGTWHRAQAIGASVALSISPPRSVTFEAITTVLSDVFLSDPEWRRDVVASPHDPGQTTARLAERFVAFQRQVAALSPEEVAQRWCEEAIRQRRPHIIEPSTHRPARTDRLRRCDPDPILYFRSGDSIHFYAGGQAWTYPHEAFPFVEHLNRHREFTAESVLSWDPNLQWEDAREVLSELCAAGVLSPV